MQIKNDSKIQIEDITKNIRYSFDFNNYKYQESKEILNGHPQIITKVDSMTDVLIRYGKIEINKLCRLIDLERDAAYFYIESLEQEGLVGLEMGLLNVYVVATKKLIAQSRNDLINYVYKCLEKKIAVKRIRDRLVEGGWGNKIIDCVTS